MSIAWHEIRDHLMNSSSTLSFQRNFDAIRRNREPLGSFGDPAALLDTLHVGGRAPDEKNQLLVALVRVAQSDGETADCALTLMLLALWPGLDAVRRRSIWRRIGTGDEVASEILARASEAIRGLDLQRVNWIAATILRNIERDLIRTRQREDRHQSLRCEADPNEIPTAGEMLSADASPELLHGDLVRIVGTDADLVIRVAIDGFSQAEVASEMGLSEAAARKRYQRATRRLRDVLQEFR
ncbi:sigma-70 family RNA polymerase sigma factor [Phaeobacter gallaeciensis]|uniref:Sigma-70 family RNA polymerase sigma factor n=1 Tax=Phaeobacter gallaeciensis TaxID=60890 RepID=A0A366X2V7_9RHOB|nr:MULTISPECIES: sigma-70 family RNA polymerase sigma factor [Roseobacteraceae]MBT8167689.1 sigma-70 family RNA polymerase sigma factor [Falsiruegeria litorea]RBW57631.1 sigma-70 family RNA polymerase sigma factor [Phaeobacter gallaeciensis]